MSHSSKINIVESALKHSAEALASLVARKESHLRIVQAAEIITRALKDGKKVMSCGNGGSMCDAMHFAEELSGRFRSDRKPYAALAISDPSYLSCVGNDLGFPEVYARFVAAHGGKGDVLLAISTSGKSQNVLNAVLTAKKQGVISIALCQNEDSKLAEIADLCIATDAKSQWADRVQELHIKVIHILIELIESEMA